MGGNRRRAIVHPGREKVFSTAFETATEADKKSIGHNLCPCQRRLETRVATPLPPIEMMVDGVGAIMPRSGGYMDRICPYGGPKWRRTQGVILPGRG